MITESITIQGLHVIFLAVTRFEQWKAARGPLNTNSSGEVWLTVFAVVALIISVVLLFWVFAKHKQSEHRLNLQITELIITNEKLGQQNNELTVTNAKLGQQNNELTVTNEKQRQEMAELYRKQVEIP